MKKLTTFFIFLVLSLTMMAAQVTIIVTSIPQNTPAGDNIYIAGNFNGWDPGDPASVLTENGQGHPQIILEGTSGIEFKFTRGSWATVEGNENGQFLPNRTFTLALPTHLNCKFLAGKTRVAAITPLLKMLWLWMRISLCPSLTVPAGFGCIFHLITKLPAKATQCFTCTTVKTCLMQPLPLPVSGKWMKP